MPLTPEQIRAQGYTILQDPSEIKDYKIVGQYGKSKTPGSFLYGTPLPKTPVAPPTNQPIETTVTPSPASPPTPITTGEAYKGYLPAENQEINKAEEDYLTSLKLKIAPVDEASIRAEKLKQFQAEIDAVNQAAAQRRAEILRTEGLAGEQRLGQTTAIQARRGLLGSDFGASQSEMTRENTRQIIAGKTALIDAERDNAVAGILGQARNSAEEEIKAKIAAREAGSKEYIDFLKGQAERKSQNAAMTLSNFLFANQEPTDQDYSEIAKLFGQSVSSLKAKFKTEKEALEAKKATAEAEKIKNLKAGLTEVDGALIDASGKVVYRAPEKADGFSLSEGQARYDATGKLIAERKKTYKPGVGGGGSYSPLTGKTYASDLDAIIGNTLATIPTKFGQQQFNAQLSKARNDADKISLVAATVLKGQPAETKRDFSNQASAIKNVDKAINLIDQGVKTGVLKAGAQYTYNVFGKDYDPNVAAINAYVVSAIQPYRNSITGAAWGEQEDAEYQQLFGSTKYSPKELKERLVRVKEIMKDKSVSALNSAVNPIDTYPNPFSPPPVQSQKPQQMTLPNGITVTLQADGTYK